MPRAASLMPCQKIRAWICRGVAPSAIRTPISGVSRDVT
jgi:hypothetical protein